MTCVFGEIELPRRELPPGWSLEEARKHTIVERLRERCKVFAGATCEGLPHEMWCERCLAAEEIERLTAALKQVES